MERVCHLINKIYREILCTTRREGMTYITMVGLGLDHVHVSAFSWTAQYRIVLSRDLLDWISVKHRIPPSFSHFITTPELSGPLYISPDIYHTQVTEYSLHTIYRRAFFLCIKHLTNCYTLRSLIPEWSLCGHLSRALPTEMIFYLLRSIRSERLMNRSPDLKLEIIINWLQVSVK